jgi:heterodisulfide reductase subunit B
VEADYGGLQLGAVQLLGFAFGTQKESCGVQLVEI